MLSTFLKIILNKNNFLSKNNQASQVNGSIAFDYHASSKSSASCSIFLSNESTTPVYNLIAVPVNNKSYSSRPLDKEFEEHCVKIKILNPGNIVAFVSKFNKDQVFLEISFQDVFGKYWIRRSDGHLDELLSDSMTYYGFDKPLSTTKFHHL